MSQPTRRARLPLFVTALLGLLAVALAVVAVLQVGQRSGLSDRSLTADEQGAVDAAKVIAINATTYSFKNFEADFQRALDTTTGQMHQDLVSKKPQQQQFISSAKLNSSAEVSAAALKSFGGRTAEVMVFLDLYLTNDKGKKATSGRQPWILTVERVNGKWLGSKVDAPVLA